MFDEEFKALTELTNTEGDSSVQGAGAVRVYDGAGFVALQIWLGDRIMHVDLSPLEANKLIGWLREAIEGALSEEN